MVPKGPEQDIQTTVTVSKHEIEEILCGVQPISTRMPLHISARYELRILQNFCLRRQCL